MQQTSSRSQFLPSALLVGVMGWLISFVGSWHVSLWTDEAATITSARRSLSELWHMVHHVDAVHGVYYAFMHFWVIMFGSSSISLRMPSALAVGLGATGVYVLAHKLSIPEVALLSSIIFAILPRVTWMGIEARSYAFSAAIAVWLTTLLLMAIEGQHRWVWVAYGVLAAVGVAIFIYIALLLCAHGVSLVFDRRASLRQRCAAWLLIVVALAVASPVVLQSAHESQQLGSSPRGVVGWARSVLVNQWFLGDTPTTVAEGIKGQNLSINAEALWKPAAVLLAILAWALISNGILRHHGRIKFGCRGSTRIDPEWLIPWITLPVIVVLLYNGLFQPLFNPRYLAFCSPALAVLLALGITCLRSRTWRAAVSIVILLLSLPIYISQRQTYGKSSADWSMAARYIEEHKASGQAIYYTPRHPAEGAIVHRTMREVQVAYPEAFSGLLDLTLLRAGAEDGSLFGTSRILAASRSEALPADTVWVLRRVDYPTTSGHADDRVLSDWGFSGSVVWHGPTSLVLEYRRVEVGHMTRS